MKAPAAGEVLIRVHATWHAPSGAVKSQAGQFRAVIDRRYPLQAIADAYRYVETGQKVGIVVVNVAAA
jgi:NADPH:quinone reductase-like Zn-dependent oxidoreductase